MKKILKFSKIVSLLVLFILFNSSIYALSTDWVENDKSKVRLIAAKNTSDNMYEINLGLEYQLEAGWKTYWKSPGGGGFPQFIEWKNSTNIKDIEIDWPTPKEFQILGLKSLGYENQVIFPLKLKSSSRPNVRSYDL